MFLTDLFEDINKTVCIMTGGFHPFSPQHLFGYKYLSKNFPKAAVFIASSNDTTKRPFNFQQKKYLATQAGIPADKFIQVTSPYRSLEITQNYDSSKTVLVFGLGQKDAERLGGGKLKKNGELPYFLPYPTSSSRVLSTFDKHAYYVIIPNFTYKLQGEEINSASKVREMYSNANEVEKQSIIRELYPNSKNINKIKTIFDNALLSNKITESPDYGYTKFNDRDEDLLHHVKFTKYKYSAAADEEVIAAIYKKEEAGSIIFSKLNEDLYDDAYPVDFTYENTLKVNIITIEDEWRSTGLGQLLYTTFIEYAQAKNFNYVVSDLDMTKNAENAWKRLTANYPVKTDYASVSTKGSRRSKKIKFYYIDLTKIK